MNNKNALFGGKQIFYILKKTKKQNQKITKNKNKKKHKEGLGPSEVALGPPHLTLKSSQKTKSKSKKKQKQKQQRKHEEGSGPSEVALWATSPDP